MKRRRGLSFVIGFLLFIGAVLYWHRLTVSESKNRSQLGEVESATTTSLPQLAPSQEQALTDLKEFQKTIRDCFSNLHLADSENPDELLKNLTFQNAVEQTQFEMENTHIQLPDGTERRLHLIPADSSNGAGTLELRYFKLDHEGLPERIPIAAKQSLNPTPEFLQSVKSQGKIIFHQVKESQSLKDGTKISINRIDDKVFEMQIFGAKKTFSCRQMKCQCH